MDRSEVIRARIMELEAELVTLNVFGNDRFKDGTVIRWKKRFGSNGGKYTYAAIKAGWAWYLTDRQGSKVTWEDLVRILTADGVSKVRIATEWSRMKKSDQVAVGIMAEVGGGSLTRNVVRFNETVGSE